MKKKKLVVSAIFLYNLIHRIQHNAVSIVDGKCDHIEPYINDYCTIPPHQCWFRKSQCTILSLL